ncbi:MAG: hypothetical protein ABMA64_36410 [Myxococcota bacterium]
MWLLFAARVASATEDGEGSAGTPPPEYARLSQEVRRLAERNAWEGAERTFRELEATGGPLTFDDWIRGAQAGRAVGDLGATRDRLRAATALREDPDVIHQLWDIDTRFGPVALLCDPGSFLALRADQSSLDPDLLRATEYARAQVHDRCAFEGLLPLGTYHLHEAEFRVEPHRPPVELDLRGLPLGRRARRALRDAWEAEGSAE